MADSTADDAIGSWLESLATPGGRPGGGAAAALMVGMAAGLAEMVAGYRKSPDAAGGEIRDRATRAFAAAIRESAPDLADRDAAASAGFAAAARADDREAAMQLAALAAAESSAAVGGYAARLVPVLEDLEKDASILLLADVGAAAAVLAAGTRTAALNVRADLLTAAGAAAGRQDLRDSVDELDATTMRLDAIAESVRTHLTRGPA